MKTFCALAAVAAACLAGALTASAGPSPVPDFIIPGSAEGLLPECSTKRDPQRNLCYVRGLLERVERSGNPAEELPKIDRTVRANGGYLQSWCHILMHEVGRTYGRRHGVTLENLNRYVPKSNDPGCSAGFGMGLVMHLGNKLVRNPASVTSVCTGLPTRFREYTCTHGAGHAFMRGFHGAVLPAAKSCGTFGARLAPDCVQGVFHDYWISLGGGDGTKRPRNGVDDARVVCTQTYYPLPCWYRYFWERRPAERVAGAGDFRRLCNGLDGLQRAGCVSSVSLLLSSRGDPFQHARICTTLPAGDLVACLRGVNVPAVAGKPYDQRRLIDTCTRVRGPERFGCYAWFGRTLAVVTDGRFRHEGCERLTDRGARRACSVGAERMDKALRTFS